MKRDIWLFSFLSLIALGLLLFFLLLETKATPLRSPSTWRVETFENSRPPLTSPHWWAHPQILVFPQQVKLHPPAQPAANVIHRVEDQIAAVSVQDDHGSSALKIAVSWVKNHTVTVFEGPRYCYSLTKDQPHFGWALGWSQKNLLVLGSNSGRTFLTGYQGEKVVSTWSVPFTLHHHPTSVVSISDHWVVLSHPETATLHLFNRHGQRRGTLKAVGYNVLVKADLLVVGGPVTSRALTLYRRQERKWRRWTKIVMPGLNAVLFPHVGYRMVMVDQLLVVGTSHGQVTAWWVEGTRQPQFVQSWSQQEGPFRVERTKLKHEYQISCQQVSHILRRR